MNSNEIVQTALEKLREAKSLLEQNQSEEAMRLVTEAQALRQKAEKYKALEQEIQSLTGEKLNGGGEFKSFGEFLSSIQRFRRGGIADPRLQWYSESGASVKALSESSGASGGFLVPEQQWDQLMQVAAEAAIVRPRATVIPMTSRTLTMLVLDQFDTTPGYSHYFGGMRVLWVEEASAMTESTPTFRRITLNAHRLGIYSYIPDDMLSDAGGALSLEAYLTGPMGFPAAITNEEDYCFLNGSGTAQPLGVLVATSASGKGPTLTVERETASSFGFVDAINMLALTLPGRNYTWVFSQSVLPQLYQMRDSAGRYVWVPNAQGAAPGTLFGYPVIFTEKLPVLGETGDVLLADFTYYVIGDRRAITIDSSTENKFEYGITTWRAYIRVDGQPWMSAPLTLRDGTTKVSPFVILGKKA